jgi:hypothetical protein|tara:strand:+ start:628 stop:1323 length:696 start_codon:yes stop_codon:yes gene_type:complete
MATSDSKNFEPDVGEFIEEAFERCGIELRTGYDLKTATRSLNLMLAEWANRGLNQWTIAQKTVAMVKDTAAYNIDSTNATAPIDVLDAFMRETINSEDTDLPMTRISRSQYSSLPKKSTTAKPNQFMVDKQLTPTVTVYPAPDKSSSYTLIMNVLTRMDDADAGANTMEMPYRFYPCLAAGLAYYISLKKAPDRTGMLKQLYEEEFLRAMNQDEPRSSFMIAPDLRSYNHP